MGGPPHLISPSYAAGTFALSRRPVPDLGDGIGVSPEAGVPERGTAITALLAGGSYREAAQRVAPAAGASHGRKRPRTQRGAPSGSTPACRRAPAGGPACA